MIVGAAAVSRDSPGFFRRVEWRCLLCWGFFFGLGASVACGGLDSGGGASESAGFRNHSSIGGWTQTETVELSHWRHQPGAVASLFAAASVRWVDVDGDGLADAWEARHGLTGVPLAAEQDQDGDGATAREEYLAGTDPRDRSSKLMPSLQRETVGTRLQMDTVIGRRYTILASPDLRTWLPWAELRGDGQVQTLAWEVGSSATEALFPKADGRQFFFQVEVEIAP